MAIRTQIGRPDGSLDSVQLPVTVWQDTGATLSENDAFLAALGVIPGSLFSGSIFPTGTPSLKQESRDVYSFKFTYQPPEQQEPVPPEPPETGSLVRRANCSTKSKTLTRYISPVGVFAEAGDMTAYYEDQKWSPKKPGPDTEHGQHGDVTVDPLQETRTLDYYIPNAELTESYVAGIEALVEAGAFNNGTFFDFTVAAMQIVRYSLQERSANDWELSLGFGRRPVKTNVQVAEGILIPTLRACDHYYVIEKPVLPSGSDVIQQRAMSVVVGQAWPLMDFTVLNLPGQ
jgi:hypothetical protein